MTRKYGGTGLGLILSKRLAEALGGSLELVSSELGKGSHFMIRIQPDSVEGAKLVNPEMVTNNTNQNAHGYTERLALNGVKVLVVDDSADNRVLVTTFLKKAGALVTQAEDGSIAVQKATEEDPDMILMDIQMPVMDGHRATQTLRSQGYEKPIIALTAHAMREEKERCFASGCTEFMTKPLNRELLMETLSKYRPASL
jgi:CheY-like chemotaxis protein